MNYFRKGEKIFYENKKKIYVNFTFSTQIKKTLDISKLFLYICFGIWLFF